MSNFEPRVLALLCDGVYQRYLTACLASRYRLAGIVLRAAGRKQRSSPSYLARYAYPLRLWRHLAARRAMRSYAAAAQPVIENLFYRNGVAPQFPLAVPQLTVEDINAPEAARFVQQYSPDIVCVNGTNLLRSPMLALAPQIRYGFINLHTGLSPYTRGGNCDLFALIEGHPELVGITIHHIDAGIDSGDIILTARPTLDPADSFEVIQAKICRLGIDLMLTAIQQLVEGRAERVKQWEEGKLFLKRTGYYYEPRRRVEVNRILARGLIAAYLARKEELDRGIRLIGRQD